MTNPSATAAALDHLDTLGFDGRVWVDVEALVISLQARSDALGTAADLEPDLVERAALHARSTELQGRADALTTALLDGLAPTVRS